MCFFLFTRSNFHVSFTQWRYQNSSTCNMRLLIYFHLYIKKFPNLNRVFTISTIICLRNVNMTYKWTSIFFHHLPLGMGNTRGKCKAKYYQPVFKCMQLNNVLSVVTGTYLGGGGTWNDNFMCLVFYFFSDTHPLALCVFRPCLFASASYANSSPVNMTYCIDFIFETCIPYGFGFLFNWPWLT